MDKLINIGLDKNDYRTEGFLKEYYQQNKNELRKFEYKAINAKVTLIANNNGWCTAITNTGNIIQTYAGELTCI